MIIIVVVIPMGVVHTRKMTINCLLMSSSEA